MADWKNYTGLGTWTFTPSVQKPTYNEGDKISTADNAVWDLVSSGGPITLVHNPGCGYWTKEYIPAVLPPELEDAFQTYFELMPGVVGSPDILAPREFLYSTNSITHLNQNDFDGEVTWYFEVFGFNNYSFDVTLEVVDSDLTSCASVVIPAGTYGTTGYEVYRFRSSMTPTISDDIKTYMLKFSIPTGETVNDYPVNCMITTARIIVEQTDYTKTKIQIPLFSQYNNVEFLENLPVPSDYGAIIGTKLDGKLTPHTTTHPTGHATAYWFGSVWRYDSAELDNISAVEFTAVGQGAVPKEISDDQATVSSTGINRLNLVLYTTDSSATPNGTTDATPAAWVDQNTSYYCNLNNQTFTPRSDSYFTWVSATGTPHTQTISIDLSDLTPGQYWFAVGGEYYTGTSPANRWDQFGTFHSIIITADHHIENAEITYNVTDSTHVDWELNYEIAPDDKTALDVVLFDITASSIVAGSTMSWAYQEVGSRKYVTLSPGLLVDGHEYRYGVNKGQDAEVQSAELMLKIDPVDKLTTWRRCGTTYSELWDNYFVSSTWGADYYSTGSGSICPSPQIFLEIIEDSDYEYYFEITVHDAYGQDTGQEAWKRFWLEDLGSTPESGVNGSDVTGSLVEYPTTSYQQTLRSRVGPLTLENEKTYCTRHYSSIVLEPVCVNAFLVTKVKK